jgi:hypothetical protein
MRKKHMATNPPPPPYPQMQPPYPPARKKTSPIVWVLVILGSLFLIFVLLAGAGVYYVKRKINQVGVSAEMLRRNPALASAKIAAAMNPNIEVVSFDEDRQVLTFRDKKTGKVSSISFENAKNGRWSYTEDGKRVDVTTTAQGPNGTIEVKGPDGVVKMGGSVSDLPAWVPQYPGSTPENAVTSNQPNESGGVFHFKTKDSVDAVLNFYSTRAQSAGLKVTNTTKSQAQNETTGVLTAQDDESKRTLTIGVTAEDGENGVTVTYSTKK